MPKERQTCTECSMRRQKCDRNIPCQRCIKRGDGDKCTREWPKDGYNPKVHRIYPRPDKGQNESPGTMSQHSPASNSTIGEPHGSPVQQALRTPNSISGPQFETPARPSRRSSSNLTTTGPQTGTGAPEATDGNPSTVLDFLGWGRHPLQTYHLNSVSLANKQQDMDWDWDYSNGFGGTGAAQVSFLQYLLPNKKQVFQLVDYHLNSLLWYHASFHGPTFHRELSEYYTNQNGLQICDTDLRWSAVLFAVMAASMTSASDQQALSWGFQKSETAKLTRQWFKATLCCLNLADYMWRHHIFSVQAIEVLTMSAHVLGFSNTQSTLMGAALKIAQGLGLQRMSPDDDLQYTSGMDPETREKIIRREMGRRMWTQLCVQDWFSIPFSEMYTIQRNHFSTPLPEFLNDETLEPVHGDTPTIVSFNRAMVDLARTFSECHDAITGANTLLTKYDEVLKFEAKIKEKNAQLPVVMDINQPFNPAWPRWIQWARRSLAVCYAHKIIMVHRHFLGRSFTEPTFAQTREASMTAAKTILKQAKQAYDGESPVLWIDQAFIVASGITLSLDLFHRQTTDPLFEEHRKYVEAAITTLRKFDNSMIAMRGIKLLSQLLTEQARLAATQMMEVHRNKRARDSESAGPSTTPVLQDFNQNKRQKQKFDVPRFVESLGTESWSQNLRNPKNQGIPGNPIESAGAGSGGITGPLSNGGGGPTSDPNFFGTPRLNANSFQNTNPGPNKASFGTGFTSGSTPSNNPSVMMQTGRINNSKAVGGQTQNMELMYPNLDLGFETFEQLFPPQTGISNSFLFEDLLNFDL